MSAFTCPTCGKATGGDEAFCVECGQSLNITCPACNNVWRFMFDYRFCPDCGHNMQQEKGRPGVEEYHAPKSQSRHVS